MMHGLREYVEAGGSYSANFLSGTEQTTRVFGERFNLGGRHLWADS